MGLPAAIGGDRWEHGQLWTIPIRLDPQPGGPRRRAGYGVAQPQRVL